MSQTTRRQRLRRISSTIGQKHVTIEKIDFKKHSFTFQLLSTYMHSTKQDEAARSYRAPDAQVLIFAESVVNERSEMSTRGEVGQTHVITQVESSHSLSFVYFQRLAIRCCSMYLAEASRSCKSFINVHACITIT